jgi:hypothetical protein
MSAFTVFMLTLLAAYLSIYRKSGPPSVAEIVDSLGPVRMDRQQLERAGRDQAYRQGEP